MNYVYHGSSVPNLKIIKPRKSAHMKEWVYGSRFYYFLVTYA